VTHQRLAQVIYARGETSGLVCTLKGLRTA
jgi:hypothetical protein